jgi:hypothetical protein
MDGTDNATVGRTYTKGRRQPYLIRKWPGSNWALPMGPYTITQLVVFVGSAYLLVTYRDVWAHFGPLNLVIGVGVPVALTYATRHTRIEGRDPLRAGIALAGLLLAPRHGYLGGGPVRPGAGASGRGGHFPVSVQPAALAPQDRPPEIPAARPLPDTCRSTDRDLAARWVSDLVGEASRPAARR